MTQDKPINLSDQTWAFSLVILGCIMTIVCKHYGVSNDLPSGIVGGGLAMFTRAATHDASITNSPNSLVVEPQVEHQKE